MKNLLSIIYLGTILLTASCATRSPYGCGDPTNLEKRPFRVERIKHLNNGGALVHLRYFRRERWLVYECLPDTITIGKEVWL